MGYTKPFDPGDVWVYATRELTDITNLVNVSSHVLNSSSPDLILPKGLLYVLIYNTQDTTSKFYYQLNDAGTWRNIIYNQEIDAYRVYELGTVISDGEKIRIHRSTGEIKVYVFKVI